MNIRHPEGRDLPGIFRKWNEYLPHEAASKQNILRKLFFDPNFDRNGFFIAEEGGEITGFINAVYHVTAITRGAPESYDTGFINAFAVKSGGGFFETGNALLARAEDYLRRGGKSAVSTGYFPVYFTQGVCKELAPQYAQLYEKRGYAADASATLDLTLASFVPFEKYEKRRTELLAEGIYIGPLTDERVLSAIDPREGFSSVSWSAEFKSRLTHSFDYDSMRIAAVRDRVIGACIFGDPGSSPERFGPFGVAPEYRGKGLGAVLLQDCLMEMKKRGLHNAWMQWVGEGGAAWSLYRKFGFTKTHTYLTFRKKLEAGS